MKNNKVKKDNQLNEMSPGYLQNAADVQRKRAERHKQDYSAWYYFKCMQRADDFEKYAQEIIDAINNGNIGNREDIGKVNVIDVEPSAAATEQKPAVKAPKRQLSTAVTSMDTRSRQIGDGEGDEEPVIPTFPNQNDVKQGIYIVRYISTIDDDAASVWVEADSIKDAIFQVVMEYWDIKEIVDCYFDRDSFKDAADEAQYDETVTYKGDVLYADGGELEHAVLIDPSKFSDTEEVADAVADILTDGEFDNHEELLADVHDDMTTEEYADDSIYEGIHTESGKPWSGVKSSYRATADDMNVDLDTESDHDIEIITSISLDENVADDRIVSGFNKDVFKKALNKGIVHFLYMKHGDNNGFIQRQAFGTTNYDIVTNNGFPFITPQADPSKPKRTVKKNPNNISYFDMDRGEWRSCAISRVVMIYDENY